MAETPEAPKGNFLGGLGAELKKIPVWAYPVAGGVLFAVYKLFIAPKSSASTDTPDTTAMNDTSATGGDVGTGVPPTPALPPTPIPGPKSPGNPGPKLPPGKTPAQPPVPVKKTVTVVPGDTLAAIASRKGISWESLYQTNENEIESVARQHGMSSSDGGHWIFPGEVLTLPA
jgi:LysM repeat protein